MQKLRMRKGGFLRNPMVVMFAITTVCCMIALFVAVQKLPDPNSAVLSLRAISEDVQRVGKLCQMLIDMLPTDLAFTVFCPTEKAFKRDLRLQWNDSLVEEDDTYAVLTRILAFSTVPRSISTHDLVPGKEVNYDSISGYALYIWKDLNEGFVLNRVKSEVMDFKKGKIVVHLIDGVVMAPEFEQAMKPDDDHDEADQDTEEELGCSAFGFEIQAIRSEIERWNDSPDSYPYCIVQGFWVMGMCGLEDFGIWVVANSPRFVVVVDLAMAGHIGLLVRLCLKAVVPEEFAVVDGLMNDEDKQRG